MMAGGLMHRGYIKLWRKMCDSEIQKDHKLFVMWVWVLLNASHKKTNIETKYGEILLNPGELIIGHMRMGYHLGLTHQSVRTCLKKLQNSKKITIKSTNKYSIISVVNWDTYQSDEEKTTNKITNNQQTTNKQTTNKQQQNKNEKNEKNIKTTAPLKLKPISKPSVKPIASGSLSAVPSKHFAQRVGQYFERIHTACELIKTMDHGRTPFNPFQWVQLHVNQNTHPGAIDECLRSTIKNWKSISNGYYPYMNAIIKKISPNYWESENSKESENYKSILIEIAKSTDILKKLGINF